MPQLLVESKWREIRARMWFPDCSGPIEWRQHLIPSSEVLDSADQAGLVSDALSSKCFPGVTFWTLEVSQTWPMKWQFQQFSLDTSKDAPDDIRMRVSFSTGIFFCICCSFTVQKYLELQILHSSAKKVGGRNCTGEGASVHCEVTLWAALQQPLLLILPRVSPAGDTSTRETPCQLRGALTAYPFHRIPE